MMMKLGATKRTNASARCPACDRGVDAATSAEGLDATPKDGDFSICAYCASLLIFRADQTLRTATEHEIEEFNRTLGPEVGMFANAAGRAEPAPQQGKE
jgi:hypothetical protein